MIKILALHQRNRSQVGTESVSQMATDLKWKSNPIHKLHGQNSEDDIPDINNFHKFRDIIDGSTGAVGISWVWKAMDYIQSRDDAHCLQFLEMLGVMTIIGSPNQADYKSDGFRICCCAIVWSEIFLSYSICESNGEPIPWG